MKILLTAIALSTALVIFDASAQVINLTGRWQCIEQCFDAPGSFGYITQNGWDLNILSGAGMASRAWIDYPGHIWIERANAGAVYSPDGATIQFDNGTIWQRVS